MSSTTNIEMAYSPDGGGLLKMLLEMKEEQLKMKEEMLDIKMKR